MGSLLTNSIGRLGEKNLYYIFIHLISRFGFFVMQGHCHVAVDCSVQSGSLICEATFFRGAVLAKVVLGRCKYMQCSFQSRPVDQDSDVGTSTNDCRNTTGHFLKRYRVS